MSRALFPQAATIVDAGVGNLGNLRRAVERVGGAAHVTLQPDEVARARCLLLPGVGAFRPPREALRGELEASLHAALDAGAALLGICVGYQLFFDSSDEFGATDGLGLLDGRVARLEGGVSVPQIGWNRLQIERAHPLFDGLGSAPHLYFVNSYAPIDVAPEQRLATTRHGRTFVAVAGRGRVLGTQFHPEKSGEVGLRLLRNFLELSTRQGAWS
ncbi:MAG: imidazole glycerol phosphate synthase subunit HisH [Acidobacteriota bacterium]